MEHDRKRTAAPEPVRRFGSHSAAGQGLAAVLDQLQLGDDGIRDHHAPGGQVPAAVLENGVAPLLAAAQLLLQGFEGQQELALVFLGWLLLQ